MANCDETPTNINPDDAAWSAKQHEVVMAYLQSQGCDHAGVSLEPRWFLSPYLAIWAVRSKANPEAVGWWAISGDVPTDYLTAARDIQNNADVLSAFGTRWSEAAESMSRGEYVGIGKPEDTRGLAPLLQTRAEILQDLSDQVRVEENTT